MIRGLLVAFLLLAGPAKALADSNGFFGGSGDYVLTPRHAFVVGVDKYKWLRSLANPANDATRFYNALVSMGFSGAILSTDNTDLQSTERNSILDGLNDLRDLTKSDHGVMVFYFAGHGLTYDNETYLVPSDAHISSGDDVKTRAIPISLVYDAIRAASPTVAIIVLDACRDKPFGDGPVPDGVSVTPGMADPPWRTIVGFSTVLGQTTDDGIGGDSKFTAALVKMMVLPKTSVSEVFNDVRQTFDGPDVVKAPIVVDRLSGKFRLMTTEVDFSDETKAFEDAEGRNRSDDYRGFLSNNPGGYYERLAQRKFALSKQNEEINATINAVAPVQQSVVTANADARLVSSPDAPARSVALRTGESLVATGEVGGFFRVTRNDGVEGFVMKSAVAPVQQQGASSNIAFNPQTATPADINSKVKAFVAAAPANGLVTIQASLPANSLASDAPATLAPTLQAAQALKNAGVPANRIQIVPVVREGQSNSIQVMSTARF
jgi:hypothetical protein